MSEKIRSMFARISGKYDLMNSIITLGMHNRWRKKAVRLSGANQGQSVLDCACGTGDFAFEFRKVTGEESKIVAVDFTQEMLDLIPQKISKKNLKIEFQKADILSLPFEDNSFDFASIGYGIRNVDNLIKCFNEMSRVVKSGGKLVILETGQPPAFIRFFSNIYTSVFVRLAGRIIAGDPDAYIYLTESAAAFPYGKTLTDLMYSTGNFTEIKSYPLFFGVSYIYIATVK